MIRFEIRAPPIGFIPSAGLFSLILFSFSFSSISLLLYDFRVFRARLPRVGLLNQRRATMPAAPQSPHVRRRGRDVSKVKQLLRLNPIRCFSNQSLRLFRFLFADCLFYASVRLAVISSPVSVLLNCTSTYPSSALYFIWKGCVQNCVSPGQFSNANIRIS